MPVPSRLLQGGTLVDGTGAPPHLADVLIRGGRIAGVGAAPAADELIDCTGLLLLPGQVLLRPDDLVVDDAQAYALLRRGVTTVVGRHRGLVSVRTVLRGYGRTAPVNVGLLLTPDAGPEAVAVGLAEGALGLLEPCDRPLPEWAHALVARHRAVTVDPDTGRPRVRSVAELAAQVAAAPARRLRIGARGVLAVGAVADLVVVTPGLAVTDVFVNGQRVLSESRPTGVRSGVGVHRKAFHLVGPRVPPVGDGSAGRHVQVSGVGRTQRGGWDDVHRG